MWPNMGSYRISYIFIGPCMGRSRHFSYLIIYDHYMMVLYDHYVSKFDRTRQFFPGYRIFYEEDIPGRPRRFKNF